MKNDFVDMKAKKEEGKKETGSKPRKRMVIEEVDSDENNTPKGNLLFLGTWLRVEE